MKIYCVKHFIKLVRKAFVADDDLRLAIRRAEQGSIDAKLGSGLIKQRIARENEGRSGGFRSIVFFENGEIAVFMHLFAKSDADNLDAVEKKVFRKLAKAFSALSKDEIEKLVENGEWKEIAYENAGEEENEVP